LLLTLSGVGRDEQRECDWRLGVTARSSPRQYGAARQRQHESSPNNGCAGRGPVLKAFLVADSCACRPRRAKRMRLATGRHCSVFSKARWQLDEALSSLKRVERQQRLRASNCRFGPSSCKTAGKERWRGRLPRRPSRLGMSASSKRSGQVSAIHLFNARK